MIENNPLGDAVCVKLENTESRILILMPQNGGANG